MHKLLSAVLLIRKFHETRIGEIKEIGGSVIFKVPSSSILTSTNYRASKIALTARLFWRAPIYSQHSSTSFPTRLDLEEELEEPIRNELHLLIDCVR